MRKYKICKLINNSTTTYDMISNGEIWDENLDTTDIENDAQTTTKKKQENC